ncbi:peptidoglycan DD-metalloendopeptidase family protein [candidate division KSB1 bacterium]|nr:peptidoglycan DD-metalloendopeptidase family protein [candidate division KSB1 bacterium]
MKILFFMFFNFCGCLVLANTPVPVDAFGKFIRLQDGDHLKSENCSVSQNGRYQVKWEGVWGDLDFFSVSRLLIFCNDSCLATVDTPRGQGFYISNCGFIAAVSCTEGQPGRGDVFFYDRTGKDIFDLQAVHANGFNFSQNGRIFAFNSAKGLVVVDLLSFKTFLYDKADLFSISSDGHRIATLGTNLKIWENGTLASDISVCIQWPRKMVFSPDAEKIAIVGKNQFVVIDARSKKIVFSREDFSFCDVRWDSTFIEVGAQERSADSSVGIYLQYTIEGKVQQQSKTLPHLRPGERHPEIRLNNSSRDTIFWPLAPFDQPLPLGNSYEEYQDYSGYDPYPHPGIDMMSPDRTPVYAVAEGVVKAVLTTSGAYHWRVAIADVNSAQETEGWLYAHLEQNSISIAVGDIVKPYDFLGNLVPWPIADFTHLHFVKIADSGQIWSMPWDAIFNPLDVLRPRFDPTAPVFYTARDQDTLAFCLNETDIYLDADSLFGEIDIVTHVGDFIGHPQWECSIYSMEFKVVSLESGKVVYGPFPAMTLSHVIPQYTADEGFTHILYKNDEICNSEGNYDLREYFMILTNSNGDTSLEESDANLAWDTRQYPDGPYRIIVSAFDAGGNKTTAGMNVTLKNHPVSVIAGYDSLMFEGEYRRFKIHLPGGKAPPGSCPLVIGLHGGGPGNAENFEKGSGFSALADSAGFIVVYPEGIVQKVLGIPMRTWNAGWCCGQASVKDTDDVGFISALIDTLLNRFPVNPARVYITGISNGGMMCYRLACEIPEKIAAIAPVAATMVLETPCLPRLPVPVIHFHSSIDQNVPYHGGYGEKGISNHYNPPVDSVLTVWGNLNGCSSLWDTLYCDDNYCHFVKTGCYEQADVELYLDFEGGHSWPGGDRHYFIDTPSQSIRATHLMWDFFQKHHRVMEQKITYEDAGIKNFYVSPCYPNPFNNATCINFQLPQKQVISLKIYDLSGREVAVLLNEEIVNGPHRVVYHPGAIASGVYFYRLQTPRYCHVGKLVYLK